MDHLTQAKCNALAAKLKTIPEKDQALERLRSPSMKTAKVALHC